MLWESPRLRLKSRPTYLPTPNSETSVGGKYANYWSKKDRERACDNGAGVMTYRYLKKCDACTCLHKFLFSPSLKKKGTTWQAVSWYHCLRIPGFLACCYIQKEKTIGQTVEERGGNCSAPCTGRKCWRFSPGWYGMKLGNLWWEGGKKELGGFLCSVGSIKTSCDIHLEDCLCFMGPLYDYNRSSRLDHIKTGLLKSVFIMILCYTIKSTPCGSRMGNGL